MSVTLLNRFKVVVAPASISSVSSCCRPVLVPRGFRFLPSSDAATVVALPSQCCRRLTTSSVSKLFGSRSEKTTEAGKADEEKKEEAKESSGEDARPPDTVSMEEYRDVEKRVAEHKAREEAILDKYRRAIAENDNMRKRLTKQIEDAKVFGIQGFCKDLLDVADVLSKAVDVIEDQGGNKDMIEGVKLTQTQLLQVFSRHGLMRIAPTVGEEKFDPNLHEALFQIPAFELDENIILDVQKLGYSLHGRTIRPALVGVSKK